jgi:DNA (cytosine-5)-methyltransferase 1
MNYLSICSGIEAATVAWHHMGWQPAGFAEIEKFPAQVLAHHYPNVRNYGDLTKHDAWGIEAGSVDLLVGGTPCQAFSVAGLRRGMEDERGQLTLEFVRLAARLRPRWIVWENVPGVLSSGGGRDFGSFLGALGQLGYGYAYRVLDAQYFGVAQRRRRVFVVGYFGDWRRAAAVLFERESVRGNPPPRREAWEGSARSTAASLTSSGRGVARSGESRGQDDVVIGTITARMFNALGARDIESGALLAVASGRQQAAKWPAEIACTLNARYGDKQGLEDQHALGGASLFVPAVGTDCFNARQDPVQYGDQAGALDQDGYTMAVAYDVHGTLAKKGASQTDCHTALRSRPPGQSEASTTTVVAFKESQSGCRVGHVHATLDANKGSRRMEGVLSPMAVRRLTPVECERLPGANGHGVSVETCHTLDRAQGQAVALQPLAPTITASNDPSRSPQSSEVTQQVAAVHSALMQVRRLTPVECERLQGFPDGYTDIRPRGKDTPDGPRYKALGNSMAVPVMRWIGERIEAVDKLSR